MFYEEFKRWFDQWYYSEPGDTTEVRQDPRLLVRDFSIKNHDNWQKYRFGDSIMPPTGIPPTEYSADYDILFKICKYRSIAYTKWAAINNDDITKYIPEEDTLVVHVRTGDLIEELKSDGYADENIPFDVNNAEDLLIHGKGYDVGRAHSVFPLEYFKLRTKGLRKYINKVAIVSGTNSGYDSKLSTDYVKGIGDFYESEGYEVIYRNTTKDSELTADDDFIYMSNARYFLPTVGSYGAVIGEMVKRNNNKVISLSLEEHKDEYHSHTATIMRYDARHPLPTQFQLTDRLTLPQLISEWWPGSIVDEYVKKANIIEKIKTVDIEKLKFKSNFKNRKSNSESSWGETEPGMRRPPHLQVGNPFENFYNDRKILIHSLDAATEEFSDTDLGNVHSTFDGLLHHFNGVSTDVKLNVTQVNNPKDFKENTDNFIVFNFREPSYDKKFDLLKTMDKEFIDLINRDKVRLLIEYVGEGMVYDSWFVDLHTILNDKNINGSSVYFVCDDQRLEENYKEWALENKECFNGNKINIIRSLNWITTVGKWHDDLLKVTEGDYYNSGNIRPKKFNYVNGAFKQWRLLLVTELFRLGLDKDGYISLIGNYGEEIPTELKTGDKIHKKYYKDIIYPKIPLLTELEKDTKYAKRVTDYYKNTDFKSPTWRKNNLIRHQSGRTEATGEAWKTHLTWMGEHNTNSGFEFSHPTQLCRNSYFSILVESIWPEGNNILSNGVFPSEKTWKPIWGMQPFIVVSSPGFLNWLRGLGFETFPEFFDESYDEIRDGNIRFESILNEIKNICSLSYDELNEKYYRAWPKLKYNRDKLIEMTNEANLNYTMLQNIYEIYKLKV